MSRYRGQALRPVAIAVRFRPGQLRRRNASGVNSDERVSCAQLRLGRILVHKLLRAALSMESNGFHPGSFTDSAERSLLQTGHTSQDWRGRNITTNTGGGTSALRVEFHGTLPRNPRNRVATRAPRIRPRNSGVVLSVRICTRIPWPLLVIGPVIGTEDRNAAGYRVQPQEQVMPSRGRRYC